MNKKLMAVAVAGALAVPAVAFAQASSVQIYGRANVGFQNTEADGATDSTKNMKSRNHVFDQGSRVGLRGTENLGGGLRAVFQIESGVNIDTGSQTGNDGAANASTGFFASRDSYAGIEGNWGRVTWGRQSVWWTNANDLTQAAYINVGIQYATGGFARVGSPSARTSNVMQYQSPVWSGWGLNVSYAPQSEASGPGLQTDGHLWGTTLLYRGSVPFTFQWDWARKDNTTVTGTAQNTITGNKVGVAWIYQPKAPGQISLTWIRLENENNAAAAGFNSATDKLRQNAWQLNWTHMFGNWQTMAQLGTQGDMTGCSGVGNSCSDTGSKAFLVSAKYHFSKRTGLYASYTKLSNESRQINDYNGGNQGVAARAALPAGADPRIFAVGVLHNF